MSLIGDAYQFGTAHTCNDYYFDGRLACLCNDRALAAKLVGDFFKDYPDYKYDSNNAEMAFQAIYLGLVADDAKRLLRMADDQYRRMGAENAANAIYDAFTGEKSYVRRNIGRAPTPLEALERNYTIHTGLEPSEYVKQQLRYIVSALTDQAKKRGRTEKNINWDEVDLYLQPGMKTIPTEYIAEIVNDYEELFTPLTIREQLKDAKALYHDQRYGIMLAWFGGSGINAYYKGQEIGLINRTPAPTDVASAEKLMKDIAENNPDYPEIFANDEDTYKELIALKKRKGL